jgi:hypothetical protein
VVLRFDAATHRATAWIGDTRVAEHEGGDGNKKGVFTRDRRPKMAAHELRRRWRDLT